MEQAKINKNTNNKFFEFLEFKKLNEEELSNKPFEEQYLIFEQFKKFEDLSKKHSENNPLLQESELELEPEPELAQELAQEPEIAVLNEEEKDSDDSEEYLPEDEQEKESSEKSILDEEDGARILQGFSSNGLKRKREPEDNEKNSKNKTVLSDEENDLIAFYIFYTDLGAKSIANQINQPNISCHTVKNRRMNSTTYMIDYERDFEKRCEMRHKMYRKFCSNPSNKNLLNENYLIDCFFKANSFVPLFEREVVVKNKGYFKKRMPNTSSFIPYSRLSKEDIEKIMDKLGETIFTKIIDNDSNEQSKLESLKFLCKHFPNPKCINHPNKKGETPMMIAQRKGYQEVVDFLKKYQ